MKTLAQGIVQSDILLRTAIIEGLYRLQHDEKLFDHVFEWLEHDPLTKSTYGSASKQSAKAWFFGDGSKQPTNVDVRFAFAANDSVTFPCVTISLIESSETEQHLGDVNPTPVEPVVDPTDWPVFIGPFQPTSYSPSSGMMVIPVAALQDKTPAPGMLLLDRGGKRYPIIDAMEDNVVSVAPNTLGDFTTASIVSSTPSFVRTLESLNFRESYQIGCHVQGDPLFLTYLHSVIVFILLHYKQELLEARGLTRTVVSSSEFRRNEMFGNQLVFSRATTVSGVIRHSWPKFIYGVPTTLNTGLVFEQADSPEPTPTQADPEFDAEDNPFLVQDTN